MTQKYIVAVDNNQYIKQLVLPIKNTKLTTVREEAQEFIDKEYIKEKLRDTIFADAALVEKDNSELSDLFNNALKATEQLYGNMVSIFDTLDEIIEKFKPLLKYPEDVLYKFEGTYFEDMDTSCAFGICDGKAGIYVYHDGWGLIEPREFAYINFKELLEAIKKVLIDLASIDTLEDTLEEYRQLSEAMI